MKVSFNKIPKTYYVSTTGNNSNDGLTLSTPWATLTYAASIASPVLPGDTVYIKAGNYGNELPVFQKSGLPGSDIMYIGYKTTPGDAPSVGVNKGNPYAAYVATDMPTYTGSSRATGDCFLFENCSYISLSNFQVQNFYRGYCGGYTTVANLNRTSAIKLYNCNAMTLGDSTQSYSGFAFAIGSVGTKFANGNILNSCLAVNAGAEGIGIYGDYNTLFACKVYCNEVGNLLMDYFMNCCGSYNIYQNCYAEGFGPNYNGCHGIGVKSNAEQVIDQGLSYPTIAPIYNQFFNCTSVNIGEGLYVRHRLVQNNYFSQCSAYGTHTGLSGASGTGGGIMIRDGASYNVFDRCYCEGLESAILFQDTTEDGDAGNTPGHPGNYNHITNSIFYNCYFGMNYAAYDTPSDTGINTIANNTFHRCRYLFGAYRSCTQMIYKNNIYYGNGSIGVGGTFVTDGGSGFAAVVTAGQFTNCNFFDIAGGMPGGFVAATTAGTTTDPLFISVGTLGGTAPNFHLQSSSPARDAGVTLLFIQNDYDGILRPYGSSHSVGALDR